MPAMWLTASILLSAVLVHSGATSFLDSDLETQKWRTALDYQDQVDLLGEQDALARQLFGDKSTDDSLNEAERSPAAYKRSAEGGHSLSIVNPLDVLRQRMLLDMARRRMLKNQNQIRENEIILKDLGKRSARRRTHVSEDFDV